MGTPSLAGQGQSLAISAPLGGSPRAGHRGGWAGGSRGDRHLHTRGRWDLGANLSPFSPWVRARWWDPPWPLMALLSPSLLAPATTRQGQPGPTQPYEAESLRPPFAHWGQALGAPVAHRTTPTGSDGPRSVPLTSLRATAGQEHVTPQVHRSQSPSPPPAFPPRHHHPFRSHAAARG